MLVFLSNQIDRAEAKDGQRGRLRHCRGWGDGSLSANTSVEVTHSLAAGAERPLILRSRLPNFTQAKSKAARQWAEEIR